MSYNGYEVLKGINLIVERGQKVAFVGKNGEGKTTMARIIMEELNHGGIVKPTHNVLKGYFAQNQETLLDGNLTVFETLDNVAVGDVRTRLRDILGAFLFSGGSVDKKVKVLSGGEKARLSIARLMLEPHNFLILDEPTNHLDMHSKEILKNALLGYEGTLIVISHDRDFLEGLTTVTYEFRDKKMQEYRGDITDFLVSRKFASFRELEQKTQERSQRMAGLKPDNRMSKGIEFKKAIDRKIRCIGKQIATLEEEIARIESELETMNNKIANQPNSLEHAVFEKYQTLEKTLKQSLATWEQLNIDLEEVKHEKNTYF
jgi:ATP-binding cassette subfamily F protein 3